MIEGLIDRIYECSVVPEFWPDVLKGLAAIADCKDGMLLANPQRIDAKWVASAGLIPAMTVFQRDGWIHRNTKAERLAPLRYPGFVRDTDLFTLEELTTDPVHVELGAPHGFWHSAGTMVYAPTGDILVFDIERSLGGPPVEDAAIERLNGLRPHLARAALISARLGLERARAMAQAMDAIGLPGAVLRGDGGVIAVNGLLEALDTQFIARAFGKLALTDPSANLALQEALQRANLSNWHGVLSFPVPAVADRPTLIGHLVPVRRAAHDLFSGAAGLLVATQLSAPRAPSADLLNGLFDLTPAEARVTRAIVEGQNIEGLATELGISRETVRTQLKSVFAKTGTKRQAELVALLRGPTILQESPVS